MKPLHNIRAVAFDLDDTLCGYWEAARAGLRETFSSIADSDVSVENWLQLWAEAFNEFCPTIKKSEWYDTYLKQGEPTRTELIRRTLAKAGIEDAALARRLSDLYASTRNANLKLFPDAIAVLEELRRRDVPLLLITNGPADIQRQEIESLGIENFFQGFFIEGELGYGKPDTRVFAAARDHVGVEPSEIAMVGNSFRHDIEGAMKHQWRGIWIRRDSDVAPSAQGPEELPHDAEPPHFTIGELSELLAGAG